MDSEFQGLDSSLCQCGTWILDSTLSGIPDSLSCIPDVKAQDSRVDKQKFPGFQFPQPKISRILESESCIGRLSHKVRTFFDQKDTFPIFEGLHSVQRRALSLCLF